jgi:CheY-like chemotaxis protein
MPKKEIATVLVVDDDPVLLNIVKEQISANGYQPIVASSGEEALEVVPKKTKIDLLLTDIKMPGISGLDLAKQISTLYPEIKVLFMSGYTLPESLFSISGKEVAFLQKPFPTDALIAKMKYILGVSTSDKTT